LEQSIEAHQHQLRLHRWLHILPLVRFLVKIQKAISASRRKEKVVRVVTFMHAVMTREEKLKNRWKILVVSIQLRVLWNLSRKKLAADMIRCLLSRYRRTSAFSLAIKLFFSRLKKCQFFAKTFVLCIRARRTLAAMAAEKHFPGCVHSLVAHLDPSGALRAASDSVAPQNERRSTLSPRKLSLAPFFGIGGQQHSLPTSTPRKLSMLAGSSDSQPTTARGDLSSRRPTLQPLDGSVRRNGGVSGGGPSTWRPLQQRKMALEAARLKEASDMKPQQQQQQQKESALLNQKAIQKVICALQALSDTEICGSIVDEWVGYVRTFNRAMDLEYRLQLRVHYFDCRNTQIHRDRGETFKVMPSRPKKRLVVLVTRADHVVGCIMEKLCDFARSELLALGIDPGAHLPAPSPAAKAALHSVNQRLAEAAAISATHEGLEAQRVQEDEVEPIEFPSVKVVKYVVDLSTGRGKIVRYHCT
jgi:hypothetical protein